MATRRIDRQVQQSWLIKIIKAGRGRGGGISMCGHLLLMGKWWGDVRLGREHWFTLWQRSGLQAWQGYGRKAWSGRGWENVGFVPFTSSGPHLPAWGHGNPQCLSSCRVPVWKRWCHHSNQPEMELIKATSWDSSALIAIYYFIKQRKHFWTMSPKRDHI